MVVERCGFLLETYVSQVPSDTALLYCQITATLSSHLALLQQILSWKRMQIVPYTFPWTTLYPFQDTEPPVIDRCRSPPTVQAADIETAVVWEVPQFSDNSGMSSPGFSDGSSGIWFILLLLCFTALHPLPLPMMDKQDLFRLENGDRGQALGVHLCMWMPVKDTRPIVQRREDVCESVFMGGRYTEHDSWMDKVVAPSAYVIKMIKQQEAGGFPIRQKYQNLFCHSLHSFRSWSICYLARSIMFSFLNIKDLSFKTCHVVNIVSHF